MAFVQLTTNEAGSPRAGFQNRGRGPHHQPSTAPQATSVFSAGFLANKLSQAKDYVDSLHQNEKLPLVYGKNNVVVQPVSGTFWNVFLMPLRYTSIKENDWTKIFVSA